MEIDGHAENVDQKDKDEAHKQQRINEGHNAGSLDQPRKRKSKSNKEQTSNNSKNYQTQAPNNNRKTTPSAERQTVLTQSGPSSG